MTEQTHRPKTAAQMHKLLEELACTPGLTLREINQRMRALGFDTDKLAAKDLRGRVFGAYLDRMKKARQEASFLLKATEGGQGYSEAAAVTLAQKTFEAILDSDNSDDLKHYSKIIASLRLGDQREKRLKAELASYKRRETEFLRKEKAAQTVDADTSLSSKQRLQKYREIFGLSENSEKNNG